MKEPQKQDCILCATPAEFRWADYENRKHFYCPMCKEYQVTRSAEVKLATESAGWRAKLAEKARSLDDDTVLVIEVPSGPKPENGAYPSLRGTPTSRADIPRPR